MGRHKERVFELCPMRAQVEFRQISRVDPFVVPVGSESDLEGAPAHIDHARCRQLPPVFVHLNFELIENLYNPYRGIPIRALPFSCDDPNLR